MIITKAFQIKITNFALMNQHSIILSLGTNVSDGIDTLCKAEQTLRSWIKLDSCSRMLKNPAIGMKEGTNDFYNMLIKTKTTLPLQDIMLLVKKLESMMGNTTQLRSMGIIRMDMDIIIWDDEIIKPNDTEREYYKTLIKEI